MFSSYEIIFYHTNLNTLRPKSSTQMYLYIITTLIQYAEYTNSLKLYLHQYTLYIMASLNIHMYYKWYYPYNICTLITGTKYYLVRTLFPCRCKRSTKLKKGNKIEREPLLCRLQ